MQSPRNVGRTFYVPRWKPLSSNRFSGSALARQVRGASPGVERATTVGSRLLPATGSSLSGERVIRFGDDEIVFGAQAHPGNGPMARRARSGRRVHRRLS